jgi:hypothetical protein
MIDKKCVDYEVLSKFCFGCKSWQDKTDSPEYAEWRASHICEINHIGSSGAMESAGAISIFNRSVEKNNLIYAEYLGDGDTSSFKDVVDSEPYKEYSVIPVKLECIGHVQKRLGTRLRKLVKNQKGTSNPLHGRGKLTDTIINSMQNFYGLAIRNNLENIYAMKKAVWAVLFHCTKFDDIEYRHQMCPRDADSWCKFHLDKLNNTNEYVEHVSLPVKIFEIVKPIFKDLSADPLLSKCLHGKTQNANEAANSIIWKRCPKNIFVSRDTIQIGVNSAILEFNDGPMGVMSVLEDFGLSGQAACTHADIQSTKSKKRAARKSSDRVKKRRRALRTIKKGFSDKEKEKEKPSYVAGGF